MQHASHQIVQTSVASGMGDSASGTERSAQTCKPESAGKTAPTPWNNRPLWRFVVVFGVLLGLYYGFSMTATFRDFLQSNLRFNAAASGALLNLAGEQANVRGPRIITPRQSLQIGRGCEALDPTAFFIAAIIAFPAAAWGAKLIGILVGALLLQVINLVRIVSLYYTLIHARAYFDVMHTDVWQAGFIFLALFLWLGWAWWATRRIAAKRHESV